MSHDRNNVGPGADVTVVMLDRTDETAQQAIHACARLMADADPWHRLGRTYEDGVRLLRSSQKSVSGRR